MRKIRFAGIATLLAGICATPFFAAALSGDDIKAQIAAILAQIAATQGKAKSVPSVQPVQSLPPVQPLSPNQSQGGACPVLSRSLSLGAQGLDVLSLQQFLIAQNSASTGSATGYFNAQTEVAVQKWKSSHGLVSSGDAGSTGWGVVGPRTRMLISLNCNLPTSSPASAVTGSRCPRALPPVMLCSTTWKPVLDVYGCTTSYQCSVPLSGATSQKSVQSTTTTPATGSVISIGILSSSYCVTPWGNITRVNGQSISYIPYFTNGLNNGGRNPSVLCDKGVWTVQ